MIDSSSVLEAAAQWFGYSLLGLAAYLAMSGAFTLLFRAPAKVTVVSDGLRRANQLSRASILLNGVYTQHIPYRPARVTDVVSFIPKGDSEIRVEVRRWSHSDKPTLIWYLPENPRRVTIRNPIKCLGLACACVAIAASLLR